MSNGKGVFNERFRLFVKFILKTILAVIDLLLSKPLHLIILVKIKILHIQTHSLTKIKVH